jgi:hypothetical protein
MPPSAISIPLVALRQFPGWKPGKQVSAVDERNYLALTSGAALCRGVRDRGRRPSPQSYRKLRIS